MADVKAAVDYVMKQEDSTLSGVITRTPGDAGGTTRFGLTQRWHSELTPQGYFDGVAEHPGSSRLTPTTIPTDRALPMAETAYETQYGQSLCLDQIDNQAICTAMLSFAVVEGPQKAVQLLQAALDGCGARVDQDGTLGPMTLNAVNETAATALLPAWIAQEKGYFAALASHNPTQQKFLAGWDNRAQVLLGLL